MPRAQSTDYYHVMKFHVVDAGNTDMLDKAAGFASCTLPELSIESIEYKEGLWVYRRKYPGNPTVSDVSLRRGVVKKASKLYSWMKACNEGNEYRIDIIIYHYHRDDVKSMVEYSTATPSRQIKCYDAFPIRFKPGADFDAQTGDVSIEEIDIAVERFEVVV